MQRKIENTWWNDEMHGEVSTYEIETCGPMKVYWTKDGTDGLDFVDLPKFRPYIDLLEPNEEINSLYSSVYPEYEDEDEVELKAPEFVEKLINEQGALYVATFVKSKKHKVMYEHISNGGFIETRKWDWPIIQ